MTMTNYKILSRIRFIVLFSLVLVLSQRCLAAENDPDLTIVTDKDPGKPVLHALTKLTDALDARDITFERVSSMDEIGGESVIVAGLAHAEQSASRLLKAGNRRLPGVPGALTVWKTDWQEKPVWVVSGFDDRGLMYGLLDVADRIGWAGGQTSPMSEVREMTETPDVGNRAISLYTMNRAYWESRFYDETYWARYLDLLARNRFNTLVVIFGYENAGFLAPPYPYFFDVEGFPGVKMRRISAAEQHKNLNALNRLIEMAHARGLEFKVGIWDHIYRGGVQAGGLTEEQLADYDDGHLVDGLDAENLPDYTKAALTKFMQKVPDLDGIQFRMHNESGLKRGEEMALFWNGIFTMIKSISPDFRIDLRAKELPESIIQTAIDLELNFTITTKYWMEQLGLPFHPAHINRENQHDRRHGYADMLRYPQDYRIHWRMWTGGTQRALLWGSPEYARRFARSTHLYNGDGFEVNEPLATKMEAQPHDEPPFELLNPPYRYYDYEFERYWHFFQVFGRVTYNPETPPEIWEREFQRRFGPEGGPIVEEALHKASWVLPMIVVACSPYGKFPTTRGWAGKQRFGDLPDYAVAEGSDIQVFASFDDEARLLIEGGETAQRLPSATSKWFADTSRELDRLIARAEDIVPSDNKEFLSTVTDLKILSNLALYHARRIPAAVSYRIYERTGDPHALDDAIRHEKAAIEAWRQIVAASGDVYAPNLKFGMPASVFVDINHHLTGHWSDELGYLEDGLEQLRRERAALGSADQPRTSPTYKPAEAPGNKALFRIEHTPITSAPPGRDLAIKARVSARNGLKWVRLRYRAVNQTLDYETLPMETEDGSDVYQVEIPANQIDPTFDFMYFIEVMDDNGNGTIYPDLEEQAPYIIVNLVR